MTRQRQPWRWRENPGEEAGARCPPGAAGPTAAVLFREIIYTFPFRIPCAVFSPQNKQGGNARASSAGWDDSGASGGLSRTPGPASQAVMGSAASNTTICWTTGDITL